LIKYIFISVQISIYCKENNLILAGYYQANKNFHSYAPDVFASKIAEKIWENNNDAVLLMVNNAFIGFGSSSFEDQDPNEAFYLYQMVESKWKLKSRYNFASVFFSTLF